MEEAFAGRSGSAVALDPETGEILAMTSTPAYDPNQFTTGIEPAELGAARERPRDAAHEPRDPGPLRARQHVQGDRGDRGARGGRDHAADDVLLPGHLSVYNTVFRCHKAAGHGVVDLQRAIALSCNVYFYHVGMRLEIDRIAT